MSVILPLLSGVNTENADCERSSIFGKRSQLERPGLSFTSTTTPVHHRERYTYFPNKLSSHEAAEKSLFRNISPFTVEFPSKLE